MSRRELNSTGAKRSVSVSVLVGLVLVPLSAYAASILVSDRMAAEPGTSLPAPVPTTAPATDFAAQTAGGADLESACGDAGLGMVAAEAEGSIGDVEQAALDALREICAEQGMPLPGKPAPPPVTQTVVLADNGPGPAVGSGVGVEADDDDHDDDDHDDDHEDDHDEEDDD